MVNDEQNRADDVGHGVVLSDASISVLKKHVEKIDMELADIDSKLNELIYKNVNTAPSISQEDLDFARNAAQTAVEERNAATDKATNALATLKILEEKNSSLGSQLKEIEEDIKSVVAASKSEGMTVKEILADDIVKNLDKEAAKIREEAAENWEKIRKASAAVKFYQKKAAKLTEEANNAENELSTLKNLSETPAIDVWELTGRLSQLNTELKKAKKNSVAGKDAEYRRKIMETKLATLSAKIESIDSDIGKLLGAGVKKDDEVVKNLQRESERLFEECGRISDKVKKARADEAVANKAKKEVQSLQEQISEVRKELGIDREVAIRALGHRQANRMNELRAKEKAIETREVRFTNRVKKKTEPLAQIAEELENTAKLDEPREQVAPEKSGGRAYAIQLDTSEANDEDTVDSQLPQVSNIRKKIVEVVSEEEETESQKLLKQLLEDDFEVETPVGENASSQEIFSGESADSDIDNRENVSGADSMFVLENAGGSDAKTQNVEDAIGSEKIKMDETSIGGSPLNGGQPKEFDVKKIMDDYASLLQVKEKWRNLSWLSGYTDKMGGFKKFVRRLMKVSGDNEILARENEIRANFVEYVASDISSKKSLNSAIFNIYYEVALHLNESDSAYAKNAYPDRRDLENRFTPTQTQQNAESAEMLDAIQTALRIDADIVSYSVNHARDKIVTKKEDISVPEIEFQRLPVTPAMEITLDSADAEDKSIYATDVVVESDASSTTQFDEIRTDSSDFDKIDGGFVNPVCDETGEIGSGDADLFDQLLAERKDDIPFPRPGGSRLGEALDISNQDAIYEPIERMDGADLTLFERIMEAFAPDATENERVEVLAQLKAHLSERGATGFVVPESEVPDEKKSPGAGGDYLRFAKENWDAFIEKSIINGKKIPSALRKPVETGEPQSKNANPNGQPKTN